MNRILLLIAASFVFFTAQADLITQEEADGIVLERMSQETQQYTLYAKEGVQQKMTISSADGEVIEVNYKFWAYYINYIDNTGKYIFIKESNGNLLEVKVSEADPDDLAGWRIVVPKEIPVTDVSSTPCKQNVLKSSGLSDKVDVEFTNKGVQITHYNFGVSCDFTTVNVTHTFVNGVLRITQQGSPNQADCICYTDVSYTINGISQNEVNVIFINGVQVYCYNENYPNKYGYLVGYETCGLLIENGIGHAKGYIFISEDLKDTLAVYKFPQDIYDFQTAIFSETREWYVNVSFPEQYRYAFKIQIAYTISSLEEIRNLGLNADCTIPSMYPIIHTYHNCVPVIIHSANKK